jgi:hypothetical protein
MAHASVAGGSTSSRNTENGGGPGGGGPGGGPDGRGESTSALGVVCRTRSMPPAHSSIMLHVTAVVITKRGFLVTNARLHDATATKISRSAKVVVAATFRRLVDMFVAMVRLPPRLLYP